MFDARIMYNFRLLKTGNLWFFMLDGINTALEFAMQEVGTRRGEGGRYDDSGGMENGMMVVSDDEGGSTTAFLTRRNRWIDSRP